MKKYKKIWNYLLVALSISLTIIVLNNINSHLIPQIIQDINSGVIGAILTTIITLILLSNQTESQEINAKNSVVYEEKLKIFNEFLNILGKSLEDGKLTSNEIQNIIFSFSSLRIHISEKNSDEIEAAIKSINGELFYVDENGIADLDKYINLYTKITNAFKQELYHFDEKSQQLKTFDFNNLKEISFIPRVKALPIVRFEELIKNIRENKSIIHFSDNKPTSIFDIDDELIDTFESGYHFIDKLISEINKNIQVKYFRNKSTINDKDYFTIPWIHFLYKKKHFATYAISDKKGIHFSKLIPNYTRIFYVDSGDNINAFEEHTKDEIINLLDNIDSNINSI